MNLFYDCATLVMKSLLVAFSNLEVTGRENVPREGPLLVVSNHLHLADPPLLGVVVPRRIAFMAKDSLFRQPIVSTMVRYYGAFPVKRNKPDRQALRRASSVLEQGGVLGIFPEGKRNPRTGMSRAESGIALLATMSRATILPVGIIGTEQINGLEVVVRRPLIRVNIGQAFTMPKADGHVDGKMLGALADEIMHRIAELLPPRYHGVYARATAGVETGPELASDVESR